MQRQLGDAAGSAVRRRRDGRSAIPGSLRATAARWTELDENRAACASRPGPTWAAWPCRVTHPSHAAAAAPDSPRLLRRRQGLASSSVGCGRNRICAVGHTSAAAQPAQLHKGWRQAAQPSTGALVCRPGPPACPRLKASARRRAAFLLLPEASRGRPRRIPCRPFSSSLRPVLPCCWVMVRRRRAATSLDIASSHVEISRPCSARTDAIWPLYRQVCPTKLRAQDLLWLTPPRVTNPAILGTEARRKRRASAAGILDRCPISPAGH
jgi:hypothetical protein